MATVQPSTPVELVAETYGRLRRCTPIARERLGRPVTLTEKILFAHADDPNTIGLGRGDDYGDYRPDRIAMQDATAQMAVLQFMLAGLPSVAVPTSVHCDHLILAHNGADEDLHTAERTNAEVYDFLRTASSKYGIGFWRPGSGIIHQVVLEQYAFPGGMMIGTDSHTPNAGGLGMVAIGVGGADAVDVMAGWPFNTRVPHLIGVELTGSLSGWSSPKDVILKVAEILTVKGGTGSIVEYFGPGVGSLSATGRATITNMGAEIGATTSVFPYDELTKRYLEATERGAIAALADEHGDYLRADPEVHENPERYFDRVIRINLDELGPHLNGPHSPDRARPVGTMTSVCAEEGYPVELSAALIGSCTNSSYEDIGRVASIAREAAAAGLTTKTDLLVTPGSELVRATIERDGLLGDLEQIGATVLANACGPCIGQWQRDDMAQGESNSIVTSFNRNFPKRNDGNPNTYAFVASPETVIALALAGRLDFNPATDTLSAPDGTEVRLSAPVGDSLPSHGFEHGASGFEPPAPDPGGVSVVVSPQSDRLQLLTPFAPWDGQDFEGLRVLCKAVGKCTTDHISPAGPWLRYRGHLENISGNLYSGVNNAFVPDEAGMGIDYRDGNQYSLPDLAARFHQSGIPWVMVGDENVGEGSSREHAAMEPRFRGAKAVIARSFARIHEANLKKQGVLALTFTDPDDYDKVRFDDAIAIKDLAMLAPEQPVTVILTHSDGSTDDVLTTHTLSDEQIEWFKAGSALNLLAAQQQS
ncbi:MAG: aconitate hydratase [Actinobacteria bacterium]|nr:aconitate hydratase [Actinomycetota bacterium]MCB9388389.1 aconitate hydratase [Acidimicrobiia bacterium]